MEYIPNFKNYCQQNSILILMRVTSSFCVSQGPLKPEVKTECNVQEKFRENTYERKWEQIEESLGKHHNAFWIPSEEEKQERWKHLKLQCSFKENSARLLKSPWAKVICQRERAPPSPRSGPALASLPLSVIGTNTAIDFRATSQGPKLVSLAESKM